MTHQEQLTVYLSAFIDELARAGVRQAIISPGSRSTPIAMLMAKHPSIDIQIQIDERSAGFFALGAAKATGSPVALVCTSGTAAANYYPAVIEAYYSRVPLIVITADRPHELREVGAPQAINQLQMYGNYAKWFCDMLIPEVRQGSVQYARGVGERAAFTAVLSPAGPVHINIPLREPLVPDMKADFFELERNRYEGQLNGMEQGVRRLTAEAIREFRAMMDRNEKGLIICGGMDSSGFAEAVTALGEHFKLPVLADPLSQLRGKPKRDCIIGTYDTFLRMDEVARTFKPDYIIRFGGTPVSKALSLFLKQHADVSHFVVDDGAVWSDPSGVGTRIIASDEEDFCIRLTEGKERESSIWFNDWIRMNETSKEIIQSVGQMEGMNEGRIFHELQKLLPEDSLLFVGNSMPIRDCDTYFLDSPSVRILANRGANGIDGVISTAAGASTAGKPTYLVLGDLSFYHDMNGLLAAKNLLDLTIIIVNNDGGGIFSFLPQAAEKDYFEQLFGTPHGLDYSFAAKMYGCRYWRAENWESFSTAFNESKEEKGLRIIEVMTERAGNVHFHRSIIENVFEALKSIYVRSEKK